MPKSIPSVKAQQGFQYNAGLRPSCEGQHRGQPGSGGKNPSSEEEPEERMNIRIRLANMSLFENTFGPILPEPSPTTLTRSGWMALQFNKRKLKVMVFGPNESLLPVDFGSLATHVKLAITGLGFKVDSEFKLDHQTIGNSEGPAFFAYDSVLRGNPSSCSSTLKQSSITEAVTHAFNTSQLGYRNALYLGVSLSSLSRLLVFWLEHMTPILAWLHWLPVHYRVHFRIHLFVFKCTLSTLPV